ncbi:Maf family protein [Thermocrinis jamiesonii]|uniref:Maf family protein n=1 Tax=Thermocrinis jamiesonii TaxID=1302351 RepID=UPI00049725A0|nr:Maf family protein [Thermocrinis jamiesonii]
MRFLILASESKRRVEILKMLGYHFFVIPSRIEEEYKGNPLINARRLAYKKAFKVWKEYKFSTVLGADTIVVLDNKILGKPKDEREAKSMLRELSGRWHKVITAVAILSPKGKVLFHDIAWVKFTNIDDEEIDEYIKTGEPLDKAGAYGVQGLGAKFVERIRGDFYTVMGLPASKTDRVLKFLLD